VAVAVLLGHSEVDVEEQVPARGSRLGRAAGEQLLQPRRMDELAVTLEPLDRQRRVGAPLGEAGVVGPRAHAQMLGDPAVEDGCGVAAAVDDDLLAGRDPLALEGEEELRVVETRQPTGGERHRARHVATADVALDPPAVVRRQRACVDDAQARFAEPRGELRRRDCLAAALAHCCRHPGAVLSSPVW
jgi:hypothetical protein